MITYSDSLYFSDHFSYINYFHLTYGLKDMIFQSFKLVLELSKLTEMPNMEYDVMPVSCWRQLTADQLTGQTGEVGPTCQPQWLINRVYFN